MKLFALFLPQFHEIPENNEWWGNGFTEWTNVKRATSMFNGHVQPQVPLHNNYYNLLNKSTMQWQTKLLKQYNINGFVYYHYYFCGKKLLEKPAENLLKWKDIEQSFFFCWANHTWNRSWNNSKEVLMEQTYGTEKEWSQHFDYLLPFFKDSRYEKKDNKPLFMLFFPEFNEKKDMFEYFDKKCKENGFDGICVIETYNGKNVFEQFEANKCRQMEFIYIREPDMAINIYKKKMKYFPENIWRKMRKEISNKREKKIIMPYDGNKLYSLMLNFKIQMPGTSHGVFFEWDNTPRHSSRGYIITPPDKKKFFEYMNLIKDDEYIFINAWNEWAEGMVLEPTEHNGYKYLDWIKEWTEKHGDKEGI